MYNNYDDVSDVTGVMSTDKLLFIGDDPLMFMRKYVDRVDVIDSEYDLDSEFIRHRRFDRVFARLETDDMWVLENIFNLKTRHGTVTLFIEDDDMRRDVMERIETHWYPACAWDLTSNVGKCLITNASGRPHEGEDVRYD